MNATLRDLKRRDEVHGMLKEGGAKADGILSFFAADLGSDAGWREAVAGCDYVMHVASPIPIRAPEHEDDLIVPAREGTLRVLRASRDAGVRRVVVTSSCGEIYYGHKPRKEPFNETDWSVLDGGNMELLRQIKDHCGTSRLGLHGQGKRAEPRNVRYQSGRDLWPDFVAGLSFVG